VHAAKAGGPRRPARHRAWCLLLRSACVLPMRACVPPMRERRSHAPASSSRNRLTPAMHRAFYTAGRRTRARRCPDAALQAVPRGHGNGLQLCAGLALQPDLGAGARAWGLHTLARRLTPRTLHTAARLSASVACPGWRTRPRPSGASGVCVAGMRHLVRAWAWCHAHARGSSAIRVTALIHE